MKAAIIGAGFTGLSAAVDLVDAGWKVTVFEAEKRPGGLAVGFLPAGWDWSGERFYHHIFANDKAVIDLAAKVGLPAFFQTPKTNSLINGKQQQLDSPLSLLLFSDLSLFSRLRMGLGLVILKLIRNGLKLERWRVVDFLPGLVGEGGYEKVWKPLLAAKFGPYLPQVNMAWFWARVYKRTQSLGYFEGGFQALADKTAAYVKNRGGKIRLGEKVKLMKQDKKGGWWVNNEKFDKVLITTPATLAEKLLGEKAAEIPKIDYLWAQTMVLELEASLMKGYWLNILEKDWPFLVAVEQTNFVDKSHYGGKTIVYLGNYLADGDKRLKLAEEKLLELFLPFLSKINPSFKPSWVKRSWCFEAPFAQPVFGVNYSQRLPGIRTALPDLYIANMSQVYPWDRGTNYAVELGLRAANLIKND
ncbi:MAG: FAD-dependent oxidoreductase [Microgenomates group bacterium]